MKVTRARLSRTNRLSPEDYAMLVDSYDPINAGNSSNPDLGKLQVCRLKINKIVTVDRLHILLGLGGTSITNGYAAIYKDGTLVEQSQNLTTALQSSGLKTFQFLTPVTLEPGYIDVTFWVTGSTAPGVLRGSQTSAQSQMLVGGEPRYATADTGLTTTAPGTIGTKTASNQSYWIGLSKGV